MCLIEALVRAKFSNFKTMGFSLFKKIYVYAFATLFVFTYNSAAEETCETLSTEIHVIKGIK